MSIYRFSEPSTIREVQFRYANDRPPVGLLMARTDAPADQLSPIKKAIELHGWQCVPAYADGRDVLQVEGFKEAGELSAFLTAYHFAEGAPAITPEAGDHPSKSTKQWLQHHSLKAAGWLNLVGDAALLKSGVASGRKDEIVAGGLYTAGAAVLARYGNVKTAHQIREVSEKTAQFLEEQAGKLPEDCGLFSITKQRREGFIPDMESFLYRYPSDVMLGAYTMGAFAMLNSGLKQKDPWGAAYAVNSIGLKAASLVIREKSPQDQEKSLPKPDKTNPVSCFVHWVQEKPLRLFGFGSMVSDTLLGLSAFREYKNNPQQKSYIFKFISTGTYIAADLLTAISNKNPVNADGKFDSEEQRRIEALAAEAIARQPIPMRDGLIQQVAGFLATQPEMQGKAADIAKHIAQQVEHMPGNPWAARQAEPNGIIINR